jgi:hypothetical protein
MTFLEQLQAHKGGLLHLKTELYWYGGRGSDGTPGRVCLILDASTAALHRQVINAVSKAGSIAYNVVLLLIDGQSQWVLVAEKDIELLVNDQPIS